MIAVGLAPAGAPAADETAAQSAWDRVFDGLGPALAPPTMNKHYGNRFGAGLAAADVQLLRLLPPLAGQPYPGPWRQRFGGHVPRQLLGSGLSGWGCVAKRLCLGAAIRAYPQARLLAGGPALALQILDGTSNNSSFFAGVDVIYMQTGQWRLIVPGLFLEWSTELYRTAGDELRRPWVVYLGARLDQGLRLALGRTADVYTQATPMKTYIRSLLRFRHGPLELAYDFGGQQRPAKDSRPVLAHGLAATWLFIAP